MSTNPPKFVVLKQGLSTADGFGEISSGCEVISASSIAEVRKTLEDENIEGVILPSEVLKQQSGLLELASGSNVLQKMPDGVAVVDKDNMIKWSNCRMNDWFGGISLIGIDFYEALGNPEVLGPVYTPLSTALKTGRLCKTTIKTGEHNFFQLRAIPIDDGENEEFVVLTMRDVTSEMLHLEKLESIHRAGNELADLTPEEVFQMGVSERIELLKANIIHYTQDLLNFDVVEIRLIDQKTLKLATLLSVGIDAEESLRPLYARSSGNGVSGFVCATGKSYLCEDTSNDPLYVQGLSNAKSSLTVPLIFHDQVIGSLNVESPKVSAFAESDLQLLEIFARDIAVALNTLELLIAQRTTAAHEHTQAIRTAVAGPIDEILNETVHVIKTYGDKDENVSRRLRSILKKARAIKQRIQEVGRDMAPDEQFRNVIKCEQFPLLHNARVLVVDEEQEIRDSAHEILGRYGSNVETAHSAEEALLMIRNSETDYDAIICAMKISDMKAYDFIEILNQLHEDPPVALTSEFGYDPGHTLVKARKAGLRANMVMIKPFREVQLAEMTQSLMSPGSG